MKSSSAAARSCSPRNSIGRRRTRTTSSSQRGASSAFYEQSLYKHGWSLFKQSLNDESLPSFAGVLDQKLVTKAGGTSQSAIAEARGS